MEERIDWTALARYLLQDMETEEKEQFQKLLEEDADIQKIYREVCALWEQSSDLGEKLRLTLSQSDLEDQVAILQTLIEQEESDWTQLAMHLQDANGSPLSDEKGKQIWNDSSSLGRKIRGVQAGSIDMEAQFAKMNARIANEENQLEKAAPTAPLTVSKTETLEQPNEAPEIGRRNFFYRIAAAVALIVTASGLGYYFTSNYDDTVNYARIATQAGEIKQVTLADGSMVWLNENTIFQYPEAFAGNERKVLLEGEAFFDIEKNPNKPFRIQTELSEVEVLGTSFNVNAYENEKVTLAVETGKVKFSAKNNKDISKEINPSQIAVLEGNKLSVAKGNAKAFSDWRQASLKFNDQTLLEVFRVLEKTYDVTIKVADSQLVKRKFTGSFENKTIGEAMQIIGEIIGFEFEQNENAFLVKKK